MSILTKQIKQALIDFQQETKGKTHEEIIKSNGLLSKYTSKILAIIYNFNSGTNNNINRS